MTTSRFETGKAPHIHITGCGGDLVVKTWGEAAVRASGKAQAAESEKGLELAAGGDLQLLVPAGSSVTIDQVGGDCVVKRPSGPVHLGETGGDLLIISTGDVDVETVYGDLVVKNLEGSLSLARVHGDVLARNLQNVTMEEVFGDVSVRNANGDVTLEQVMGDIAVRTINGNLTIAHGHRDANLRNLGGTNTVSNIGGDIRLQGSLGAGKHVFEAARDIVVRWPLHAPLNLSATAPNIENRLPLEGVVQSDHTLSGRIAEEDHTTVTLEAGRKIVLKDIQVVDEKWSDMRFDSAEFEFDFDFEELGARINEEVAEHASRIAAMAEDIESKFGPEFTQNVTDKINSKVERALRRAEQAASRASRRAARRSWQPPKPPAPPGGRKKTGATAEEQLKILKMVEQGIITPDEASTLLEALDPE